MKVILTPFNGEDIVKQVRTALPRNPKVVVKTTTYGAFGKVVASHKVKLKGVAVATDGTVIFTFEKGIRHSISPTNGAEFDGKISITTPKKSQYYWEKQEYQKKISFSSDDGLEVAIILE